MAARSGPIGYRRDPSGDTVVPAVVFGAFGLRPIKAECRFRTRAAIRGFAGLA